MLRWVSSITTREYFKENRLSSLIQQKSFPNPDKRTEKKALQRFRKLNNQMWHQTTTWGGPKEKHLSHFCYCFFLSQFPCFRPFSNLIEKLNQLGNWRRMRWLCVVFRTFEAHFSSGGWLVEAKFMSTLERAHRSHTINHVSWKAGTRCPKKGPPLAQVVSLSKYLLLIEPFRLRFAGR